MHQSFGKGANVVVVSDQHNAAVPEDAEILVRKLEAERGPLAARVVAADEEERELRDKLVAAQMRNQSFRARLLTIDRALEGLRPLLPPDQRRQHSQLPVGPVEVPRAEDPARPVKPESLIRQAVLLVMRDKGPMTVEALWQALGDAGLPQSPTRKALGLLLSRMIKAGQMTRIGHGVYDVPRHVSADLRPGLAFVDPDRFRISPDVLKGGPGEAP
jgi:hypothetical protein